MPTLGWPMMARYALAATLGAASVPAAAQQFPLLVPASGEIDADRPSQTTTYRPPVPELAPKAPVPRADHPLASVIKYARQEQAYLLRTVRDFTCRLVKRERIDGFLQDYQFIDMRVREERRDGNRIAVPLNIYLHFLGPANVAGRQVLFIKGKNDGKMLVRNGGKHFDYVVVNVDPQSENARRESLVPITETGFNDVLARMIDVLDRHIQADPSGANTKVQRIAGAKINKRPSTMIRITHPEQQKGLEFHVVSVFIDDELHLPVRVEYFDWPKWNGQSPPLIAEYTYTDLRLNQNLNDADFAPSLLRARK